MNSLPIDTHKNFYRIHKMPFGTEIFSDGKVLFQLAAPSAQTVDLILHDKCGSERLSLTEESDGRFTLLTDKAKEDSCYQFLINGKSIVPDPASRSQPNGVHGSSKVVNPLSFQWTDHKWKGKEWKESIIYELHVGTFTSRGTYKAAEEKLDQLINLGITAVELMPLADFPGQRNWGYDGVALFAPAHQYGSPNDLKHLIDLCHNKDLMVFLDVVYNHFGPEGNYLHSYAENFFTEKYKTPWGAALNFDDQGSHLVREFFIHNALYWLEEFHFDGLRLDAIHAINDASNKHIVMEISERIKNSLGENRHIHIILENDNNAARFLQRQVNSNSPLCATAQWNDDFHHIVHVIACGEDEGYYSDYSKKPVLSNLGKALTEGFIYQGEVSLFRDNKRRGEASKFLPTDAFISFLQNHDQIGNRAFGERLSHISNSSKLKLLTAIFLLAPQIPMLFMGEEWAASTPFYYFCDLNSDLASLVTAGRRDEFRHFSAFQSETQRQRIPDPCAIDTFEKSVLHWQEIAAPEHQEWLIYYRELIEVRKKFIIPLISNLLPGKHEFRVFDDSALVVKWYSNAGKSLKLFFNISNQALDVDPGFINLVHLNNEAIIFEQPQGCIKMLSTNQLPPYSVSWAIN